jgi:hypothetical protein
MVLYYILGDLVTNSSGHPDQDKEELIIARLGKTYFEPRKLSGAGGHYHVIIKKCLTKAGGHDNIPGTKHSRSSLT